MRKLLIVVGLMLWSWLMAAADLSGTWRASVVLDAGSGTATFVLTQKGEALSGTYSGTLGEAKVTGSVKGEDVEWSFDTAEAGKIVYKGKLGGDGKIKGTVDYGELGKGSFTAEKK
jgi:hypothetical protein